MRMDDMYLRGVLSSAYEERGSVAVLHIMDEDVIDKIVKDMKLKKYKTVYDDVACEYLLVTSELDKMRKLLDKRPKKKDDYFTMLRGAIDATCAEIYDDKMRVQISKETAKELKAFLKKERINASISQKNDSAYLQVSGRSLDKLVSAIKDIEGASKVTKMELKSFAK